MDNLIAYIRRHSVAAIQEGSRIRVETPMTKDGVGFYQIEYVQPTFQAVRDYLGY